MYMSKGSLDVIVMRLDNDQYRCTISPREGVYIQRTGEYSTVLQFMDQHLERYERPVEFTYKPAWLGHYFNNDLQVLAAGSPEDRREVIIQSFTRTIGYEDLPKRVLPRPLGACSTSYVGNPNDYVDRKQMQSLGSQLSLFSDLPTEE